MTARVRSALRLPSLLLMAVLLSGCASGKRGGTAGHEQFLAGQEAVFDMLERSGIRVIRIVGPFQRPVVGWREGATLSEVILEAGYLETRDPRQILIQRGATVMTIDPATLLQGEDVAVDPGDVIHVLP